MRPYWTVCFTISLVACLAQVALAQCQETPLTEEQRELEARSVVLILELHKSGSVREAKVLRGTEGLVPRAIKAAKARKYKHRIVYNFHDPPVMMVQVTFPRDRSGKPDVRQALPGGVPSCVCGQAVTFTVTWLDALPPFLALLLRAQPVMPVLVPQTDK
jgi:hypothetical protein